jgi:hypothetical protein
MIPALGEHKGVDGVAKAISVVFHPGFQQYYLVLYFALVEGARWDVFVVSAVALFVWPTAFYVWYKQKVLREDNIYQMKRKDRFWPILTNFIGQLATLAHLYFTQGLEGPKPPLLFTLLLVIIGLNLMANLITFGYKISLHLMGTASSCFVFYLIGGWGLFAAVLIPSVLAVGWSRLHLKGHTPPQVVWGTVVGTAYAVAVCHWVLPPHWRLCFQQGIAACVGP